MKNRSGAYKKILIEPLVLEANHKIFGPQVEYLYNLLIAGKISEIDFTSIYILIFLRIIHQKNYLQRKKISIDLDSIPLLNFIPDEFNFTQEEKNKLQGITGPQLFSDFNLRGIPQSINQSMLQWYLGNWKILLMFTIPNSYQLLKMQSQNSRVITLIVDRKKISTLILGKRDPLSFALHDLMHAHQFFSNKDSLKGQLGFYQFILKYHSLPPLVKLLEINLSFKEEFEYIVSDMNAYIIHILKSFKSAFSRAKAESVFYLILDLEKTPLQIIDIFKKINNETININEEIALKTYFENMQEYL